MNAAKNLIDKLSDEKVRWEKQDKAIVLELKAFPVDSTLAAAFTVYLSGSDEKKRKSLLQEWKDLTKAMKFDYLKYMITESKILKWKSEGLPSDSLSLENSVMIFNTNKTPLLIDPNVQATDWLKINL